MTYNRLQKSDGSEEPVRVGLIGSGYAARGFVLQCLRGGGPELLCIANRTPDRARRMLDEFGVSSDTVLVTESVDELLADKRIDAVVEATGDVEFGASVALKTITSEKHIILVNAELDGTIGPLLRVQADRAGVVYTQADGDQPAAIVNLAREARRFGLSPVLGGNIKTFFDRYRTPDSQRDWAQKNGQSLTLATGAVDGTKLAFEMATVANALEFSVSVRGMHGFRADRVENAAELFSTVLPKTGGIVDYILGAKPPFGVFVIAMTDDPIRREYLKQYKMGDGPFYIMYRPYHLCTLEAHTSVMRAVRQGSATIAPKGLYCEVNAVSKKSLSKGEMLDGIGGFSSYGQLENTSAVRKGNLLPIGLSRGCVMKHSVEKDHPLTFDDVHMPAERLIDRLYKEQRQTCI